VNPSSTTFRALRRLPLLLPSFSPAAVPPKARLVFVHGIRSHGGWYERIMSGVRAAAGFDVCTFSTDAARGFEHGAPRRLARLPTVARRTWWSSRKSCGLTGAWLPIYLAGISWGRETRRRRALPQAGVNRRPSCCSVRGLVSECGTAVLAAGCELLLREVFSTRQVLSNSVERAGTVHRVGRLAKVHRQRTARPAARHVAVPLRQLFRSTSICDGRRSG